MISGVVPFNEIVESFMDFTGIENTQPIRDKLRRFVFRAEEDIGAGGLIIRKKKTYVNGDGLYDGTNIVMPEDFIGEYSYGDLSAGVINGKILTLNCEGPDEIDVYYMGFLTDNQGNPFTTRNHLDAVVAFCIYRMYSSRYYLGKGNLNQYREYKHEYNDAVLAARGNDAFPTEAQWIEIGRILNGGAIQAFTDCGLQYVCSDNTFSDPSSSVSDETITTYPCSLVDIFEAAMLDQGPDPVDLDEWLGAITTGSTVTGTLIYKFDSAISTNSTISATLTVV